jgi:Abortive infection alpha
MSAADEAQRGSTVSFLSDDEAKAVTEVAKTGGKIIDAGIGIGSFIRGTLGTIPEDLIGIAGGDWLHQKRRRNLAKIEAETEKLLEGVALERISEPSVSVVVPLLEAAADEAREELQNLWAALLAKAMIDGGKRVRRAFFEIVRRMEPTDAIVLHLIGAHSVAGIALVLSQILGHGGAAPCPA